MNTSEKASSFFEKFGHAKPLAYATITTNTTTTLVAAVSGKAIRVHKIFISGVNTVAAGSLSFRDGTTVMLVRRLAAISLSVNEHVVDFGCTPWELTVGNALTLVSAALTSGTADVTVVYSVVDANS